MDRPQDKARTDEQRRIGERGFTLIELLVVVAVLGILAAVAVLGVSGVTSRAHNAACVTDEGTFQTALELYYADHATAAPSLIVLRDDGYISASGITATAKTTSAYTITYTIASPATSGAGTVVGTINGGGACS